MGTITSGAIAGCCEENNVPCVPVDDESVVVEVNSGGKTTNILSTVGPDSDVFEGGFILIDSSGKTISDIR